MKKRYKLRDEGGRVVGEIEADPCDLDEIARQMQPVVLKMKRVVFGELMENEKERPKSEGNER